MQTTTEWEHRWRQESAWTAGELAKLCCGWDPGNLEIPDPHAFEGAKETILRAVRLGDVRPADVHMVPATREELFYGDGTFFRPRDVAAWASKRFVAFPYRESDWVDEPSMHARPAGNERERPPTPPTIAQLTAAESSDTALPIAPLLDTNEMLDEAGEVARRRKLLEDYTRVTGAVRWTAMSRSICSPRCRAVGSAPAR
jgi:hypothetical protein